MAINQFNQPYQTPQLIYSQPQQNVPNVPGYLVQIAEHTDDQRMKQMIQKLIGDLSM